MALCPPRGPTSGDSRGPCCADAGPHPPMAPPRGTSSQAGAAPSNYQEMRPSGVITPCPQADPAPALPETAKQIILKSAQVELWKQLNRN